jgi:hypothetical protein
VNGVPDPWHFQTDPDPLIRALDTGDGSGSGSCSYVRCYNRRTKNFWLITVLLPVGTFRSGFQDRKSLRTNTRVEINVFLIFFVCSWKIRIRIREVQKLTVPTDPGPEH